MERFASLSVAVVVFIVGWFVGSSMMLNNWNESARRGWFEVGGAIYHVTEVKP